MAEIDPEIDAIKRDWLTANSRRNCLMIVETGGGWEVHQHTADSVFPTVTYPTKRLAAARILQLLGVGPVAPQAHPEVACIGMITTASVPPSRDVETQ